MATSYDYEKGRKRAEATITTDDSADDSADDTETEADTSTDLPDDVTDTSEEETPPAERPIYEPSTKKGPSYVLVPLSQPAKAQTLGPSSSRGPAAPATYPTIAEDQPGAPSAATDLKIPTPTPESPSGPTDIKTDPETGTPYVEDQGVKIPHAELATPADEAAFKPSDVTLPERTVAGTAETQPAPDTLNQVERATLVKLPPKGYKPPAPDMLTQVEKAAPVTYPTIAEDQGAPGAPPKVLPAQPVTGISSPEAQPTAPRPRASQFGLTPDEYKAQISGQPAAATTTTTTAAPPDASSLNINTDYTAQSGSFAKGRAGDGKIQGIVLHSSDGRESGDLNTLTTGGVSAHYYVTTGGRIYNLVNDGDTAYHAGKVVGPYNNSNTIGIEQEHYDPGGKGGKNGEAWSPAQVAATARLTAYLKQKYGLSDNQIMGHSDVAPERKQDPYNYPWQGFFSAVDKQGGTAPTTGAAAPGVAATAPVGPATAAGGGQEYISGKATTFGYKDPDDSGVGAPKLGGLSTNNTTLIGIAVPQAALQTYVGAHPQSWRTARVDVVGSNGQHVLVPIVDLGPRDTSGAVAADFTQGLTNLTGNTGDQNYQFKIIPNAGPDVMKDPQAFADEQAAIRAGINTGARFQPKAAAKPSYVLAPMSADQTTAATAAQQTDTQKQQDILSALHAKSTNMPDWYQTLQQPIPGVSDGLRQSVADDYKQQITKYAQDYYNEPDPAKAFARIMSAPNLLTSAGEIWTKAGANFQHAWLSIAQQADSPTQTKLIDFINAVHPEATPEARTALINQVMSQPAGKTRTDFVNHLYNDAQAHDPDSVKNINMMSLLDSIDVSAQPGMQAKEAANHAQVAAAVAQNVKDLREDPTMENTWGGTVSNAIAQMPKNMSEALIPVIGQSAMFSEIYTDTAAGLRKDHPDWSEDQIKAKAAAASLPQDVLQELVNAATLGMGSGVTKGITNPIARIAANSILHGGIAAGAGTAQQAMANVATGRLVTEGLPQAAITGGIQGALGGAMHGAGEISHPEAPTKAPLGEEPAVPPPTTGPKGGVVRGAEPETMATGGQQPLTGAEEGTPLQPPTPVHPPNILGPDVPDTSVPWYKPGPIVTRPGVERTTFTPEELTAATSTLPANATPQELAAAAARLRPPQNFGRQAVALGEEGNVEAARTRAMQTAQDQPPAPVERGVQEPLRSPMNLAEAIRAQKVADSLGKARPSTPEEVAPPPPRVSESEPFVSKIANRYTVERMATGELGQIDPSHGQSTEKMVLEGLQMSRDQREGLIKNFMKGQGGDLDQQGAAIRAREAILSDQARDASRAAKADPTNPNLQAQAKAASNAVTAFHNGPIKKFKQVWSDAGRVLQREIPLDYTTLNGMKEAYVKGKGNGNEAPPELEPRLQKMADSVSKSANGEQAAMNNLGKEIEKQTRGKTVPNDDTIRARLMEIMKDLPCRN